jgi:hypothetical protein
MTRGGGRESLSSGSGSRVQFCRVPTNPNANNNRGLERHMAILSTGRWLAPCGLGWQQLANQGAGTIDASRREMYLAANFICGLHADGYYNFKGYRLISRLASMPRENLLQNHQGCCITRIERPGNRLVSVNRRVHKTGRIVVSLYCTKTVVIASALFASLVMLTGRNILSLGAPLAYNFN